ncbi:hypothetical protein HanPSC8_Chr17g0753991 [Helianthus annuus]|nr:hypothetical protein HanPSC8_Chr17g0753991 [Helianthus annuus]
MKPSYCQIAYYKLSDSVEIISYGLTLVSKNRIFTVNSVRRLSVSIYWVNYSLTTMYDAYWLTNLLIPVEV